MTKAEEASDPNSTWNKAADNEPLFILRGKDITAAVVVLEWIKQNSNHECDPAKLRDAFKVYQAMQDTKDRSRVIG